ncbi:MAG: hypothetical protein ACN4GT_04260 [Gammaproteobacteria bacterium]
MSGIEARGAIVRGCAQNSTVGLVIGAGECNPGNARMPMTQLQQRVKKDHIRKFQRQEFSRLMSVFVIHGMV